MVSSITLNHVPHLLSLLVLVSLVTPSSSNPTEKLTNEVLKRVCLGSGDPTPCLRTLRHDPQIQNLNLGDLTLSYVERTRDRTSSTLRLIEYLIGQTRERQLILTYQQCWELYKDALRDLTRARRRLQSRNFNGIAGLATKVLTGATVCAYEDDDDKPEFPISSQLYRSNQELRLFGGIVFGLGAELVLP